MVILLGLVYPWGNAAILRPLLRTLAWVGSLIGVQNDGSGELAAGEFLTSVKPLRPHFR